MTDPHGHLDLDALADLLAGEGDDAHVRTCAACSERLAELVEADASVTAALGALPPPPLPAGLSLRLTRALQEERRSEVAALRTTRRRAPAWLPAAAASVALVLAGAAGWSLLDGPGTGDTDTAASSAGGSGEEAAPVPQPESAAGLAVPRAGTATDWSDAAARPAAVARLLGAPSAAEDATVFADSALDRLRDPAALAACLTGLPTAAEPVLSVDYARWAGAPAVAVLQEAGPQQVRVTVVGAGCSGDDPQLLGGAVLPRP